MEHPLTNRDDIAFLQAEEHKFFTSLSEAVSEKRLDTNTAEKSEFPGSIRRSTRKNNRYNDDPDDDDGMCDTDDNPVIIENTPPSISPSRKKQKLSQPREEPETPLSRMKQKRRDFSKYLRVEQLVDLQQKQMKHQAKLYSDLVGVAERLASSIGRSLTVTAKAAAVEGVVKAETACLTIAEKLHALETSGDTGPSALRLIRLYKDRLPPAVRRLKDAESDFQKEFGCGSPSV